MNLKKIQTFVLVIKKASFSEVAEILGVTQPAVSSQVKGLEKELGVRLLERHSTYVEPTVAGRYVYEMGQQLLEKWQELETGIQHFPQTLTGTIRIGTSTIPGTYLLPHWIGGFHQRFPQMNILNEVSDSREIESRLLNKKVDIAVTGAPIVSKNIVSEAIAADALVLIAPKDHPLGKLTAPVQLSDLVMYPFVFREEGSGTRSRMEIEMSNHGLNLQDIQIAAQFGSTEAILTAVEVGIGISYVSKWAAVQAVKADRVQLIPTVNTFQQTYYLSYLRGQEEIPRIKEFVEHIKTTSVNLAKNV
ncbi:DNA-binding transcriptional LysR family regulator [Pullulanibacillus pueri]|uniref:LysR family transcriptional regulator n=1 Tax=Pullulanibacillus pueri TaxID=1437324 RepID=A0A8J3ELL1_9BACL|nr:selenium metabolism-associated LysR family transcriptional regulator [Pullulanibacillus pueri]MBM7680950.1 DNA-binding transcriptional LysR family regulator [Pullulanibacillus pueri]GGH81458.1 LysR family transcriptional regulator [Pullulanibacillus pueri]